MRVNCAIAAKQSEDPAGGFPFGSPDLERYRIRRNLHPIGQLIVAKEFSSNGTPNRPELGQGSESDIAPDPRRGPHRHFQKFLAGYILFAFPASSLRRLMRHFLAALICVFTLPAVTHAAPGAIRCGKLLDVRSGEMLTDQAVVFDDGGTITSVSSFSSAKFPSGVVATDLSNATCLPGLIDVHTHLTADPTASGYAGLGISVPREAVTGVKNARLTLRAGFTTVRNVGASGYTDIALRDAINAGADVIKICASGGVLSKGDQPGTPQYTLEEMQAIAEEAHKLGRKVAAHAHGTQ